MKGWKSIFWSASKVLSNVEVFDHGVSQFFSGTGNGHAQKALDGWNKKICPKITCTEVLVVSINPLSTWDHLMCPYFGGAFVETGAGCCFHTPISSLRTTYCQPRKNSGDRSQQKYRLNMSQHGFPWGKHHLPGHLRVFEALLYSVHCKSSHS